MNEQQLRFHTYTIFICYMVGLLFSNELRSQSLNKVKVRTSIWGMWLLGNIFDFATTWCGLSWMGGREMNAVNEWFMKEFGILSGLILFKCIVVLGICVVDLFSPNRALIVLGSLVVWFAVFWNSYQLVR